MISLLDWSYNFTLNHLFPEASLHALPAASTKAFPDWSCNGFQERSIGEVTKTILETSVAAT